MGLFSFIKSAGKKLGIGGDDDTPDAEAVKKELASHDLGTEKVEVTVVDDKVVLKGTVKDQSAFEKAVIAVGNTLGISKVEAGDLKIAETLEAAPVAPKEPVFYTVKKGDNLWKIAEAHYGKANGAKHTVIFEANKPMLTHPDKIYPGQVLRIPDLAD
ncbi:peptidoglycan-binding protein LysM [Rhizobium sp. KAs_5_22]|uniref:peptidoglycan-binding protein LysM n=1 Tax=Ciceribacter selenitireducens TaxID=448181 RepID=UPI000491753C|nr:peptidoglycan-binding protein LysM [Ciceribacter selenitireducens]PPJ45160.1 peptidoglycan-binding protein LysM [Rhizobium sp. KAs_5_22]